MSALVGRTCFQLLPAYFSSGWAFALPYLSIYLLYEKLAWPVHPEPKGSLIPSLVSVFTMMHGLHLVAVLSLFHAAYRRGSLERRCSQLVSWALFMVLLLLPGIYLEFPADTWSHAQRVYSWEGLEYVYQHYWWTKFSYFAAYSFIHHVGPHFSLIALNFVAACGGLALAWQYHRLGRALGYSYSASFALALLQSLMLGNSAFSFDRYYGLSSTIVAQIAAVAAMRISVQALLPSCTGSIGASALPQEKRCWRAILGSLLGVFLLAHYSHPQGIPVALLGIAAIGVCSMQRNQPRCFWTVVGLAICASVSVALAPHLIATSEELATLQPWFSRWGGFSLLSFDSLAAERSVQVLGAFGVGAILLALPLCWAREPGGWLCLLPAVVLLLPASALAYGLAHVRLRGADDLVVFSRLFFAVPVALPYIHWMGKLPQRARKPPLLVLGPVAVGVALILLPATFPCHNRLWHATAVVPADLALRQMWDATDRLRQPDRREPPVFATHGATGYVITTRHVGRALWRRRLADSPLPPETKVEDFDYLRRSMENPTTPAPESFIVTPPQLSYSHVSFGGVCSGHWQPQEVHLAAYSGAPQLRALAHQYGYSHKSCLGGVERYQTPSHDDGAVP